MTEPSKKTSRASLARRLEHAFAAEVRASGRKLARFRRVRVKQASGAELQVRVRALNATYDVVLRLMPDALAGECTCADEARPACAHVWAAILEAARAGALSELGTASTPLPFVRAGSGAGEERAGAPSEVPDLAETRAPPASGARLSDRAARAFPPHACLHGFRAFAAGHVELGAEAPGAVDATVRGKRTRQIRLRARGGALEASCTCPSRSMGLAACRHAWAVLLEVDRRGALEALRRSRGPLALVPLGPEEEAAPRARAKDAKPAKKKRAG